MLTSVPVIQALANQFHFYCTMNTLTSEQIIEQSAAKLAQLIRDKKVSCEQVARAFLKQIDKVNPTLNAIVERNPNIIEEAKVLL